MPSSACQAANHSGVTKHPAPPAASARRSLSCRAWSGRVPRSSWSPRPPPPARLPIAAPPPLPAQELAHDRRQVARERVQRELLSEAVVSLLGLLLPQG